MKTAKTPLTQAAMTRAARDPQTAPDVLLTYAGNAVAVDRLLARHPNAPAQLLEQLSHSSDKATRKWVAIHPAASTPVLLKLAPQFPGDFFKNPVFDWLLLENPNLMVEIGGGVLKNILKRTDCPASFMAWAAAHGSEEERLAVAMNPQASASVLQEIERRGGRAGTAAVEHKNHPAVGADVDLEGVFRRAVASQIAEKMSHRSMPTFAQWPALSPYRRLSGLFLDNGRHYLRMKRETIHLLEWVCHPLVKNMLKIPLANLLDKTVALVIISERERQVHPLNGDWNEDVRSKIAHNSANLDSALSILIEAYCDWYEDNRSKRADSWSKLKDALSIWSKNEITNLVSRIIMASDLATPAADLIALADDSECWVRRGVARNPVTPAATLRALARDKNSYVRRGVASNPTTPVATLRALSKDPECWVRRDIASNPATPAATLAALADPRIPDAELTKLIYPAVEDAYRVSFEPTLSLWWLKAIAKLKIAHEKREIPTRWTAWPTALKMASPSRNQPQVQNESANLIRACEEGDILYLPEDLATKACRKPDFVLRLLGLASRHAEPAALAKRSRSIEWLERMAVARNANTPPNVIKSLCEDPHRLVALQAKATFRNQVENAHQIPQ